jgi:prepilin-type N-terminal cleavage/methylation domain-containing protein
MTAPAQRGSGAFTLIELLAVLFIIALVLGITLPNLSLRSDRVMLGSAQDLAARLSFARQRAVATGTPHRIVIDLDASAWWIEVRPDAACSFSAPPPAPSASREVQLAAPRDVEQPFVPLAGPFGRPRQLPEEVFFASIETLAAGPVVSGQVGLVFEEDGTADPALFVLENDEGAVLHVQLARLADEVQIRRE